ncbi:acetyl-CoA carboxylase carboxyltransferase subunit alpha [bacterium]|nr:acetyl-CoA carboxylase carboxyltransferase subunit alpha [bacterium]RQV92078.1 MAG: acetyl-CoA carboxylase carboxyltransferase subunit alpha [bacterium]
MAEFVLDFEKPIVELEKKIAEMKNYTAEENVELVDEIKRMESRLEKLMIDTYSKLTRWQRVQLARHPNRPYTLDYIERIFTDFVELHGDRLFSDDPALVSGLAKLDGLPIMVLGQQKGRTTKEKLYRNFGMLNPEGYRKALRLMKMAVKFHRPIVVFIDTPGAYPGLGAEERGQGEAIARNLFEMSHLAVPILVLIIGEGASGGALGIGVGDRILMMENGWYSVISPEGCAAILWRDNAKANMAAEALKLAASDLIELGVIDGIIKEPIGGAHRDVDGAAKILKKTIIDELNKLSAISTEDLVKNRLEKYAKMGFFDE